METSFTGNGLLLTVPSYANFLKAEEMFSFGCINGWFTWLEEVQALDCCWEENPLPPAPQMEACFE